MDMANINGKMVENIKANINMIKSMVQENILGQMAEDIMDNGKIVRDMDKVKLYMLMALKNQAFGKTINV